MTLFVGGPWDGRDMQLRGVELEHPYMVLACDEERQTFTQVMYTPRRWAGPGGWVRTVFAPSWWQNDTAEISVRAWLLEHPEEPLPQ